MIEEISPFEDRIEGLQMIRSHLPEIIPFNLKGEFAETDTHMRRKIRIREICNIINTINPNPISEMQLRTSVRDRLIDLIEELQVIDLRSAYKIAYLLVQWEYSARSWYETGKLLFQMFINRKFDDIEAIVGVFNRVIELGKKSDIGKEFPYWAYVFLGNIYLYKILTGEEALEQALKFYNVGYRYAKTQNIQVNEEIIFDNVETMQQILMNQYPLLVVIYNDTGGLLYEFLFQFIEVMNQDQRFIPNFTALLSAVDDHINELFRSPVSSSYIVMRNRLLVISTIQEDIEEDKWVKTAMVFSYLQQKKFEVDKDMILLDKVNRFNENISEDKALLHTLTHFNGKRDETTEKKIHKILDRVFSEELD